MSEPNAMGPWTRPRFAVPAGACDSHVHVFLPDRFPYVPERVYTPAPASVASLAAMHRALGIERVVLVQPTSYGTDNACMVAAAREIGPAARIVAVIDEQAADAASLQALHGAGTRGVRLNLETYGIRDPAVAGQRLARTAALIAPLGWHLQFFASLATIAAVADAIGRLPVPVVIDHFGRAGGAAGPDQPGFAALLALVRSGHAYVKLSGAYRLTARPDDYADMVPLARALIAANPDRMVWGSDWPHPGAGRTGHDKAVVEPFLPVDAGRQLGFLADWAPDPDLRRRILVDNPARLYDFAVPA